MLRHFIPVSAFLLASFAIGGSAIAAPNESQGIRAVQQDGTCTGVVKDAAGETIIGASVLVKGTTNGVITDIDGNFQLRNVKPGDIIQISYIGYSTQEFKWEGQPLNVVLREDTELLDEVVVVGYATVKKANLTGAVSAVDEEVLESRQGQRSTSAVKPPSTAVTRWYWWTAWRWTPTSSTRRTWPAYPY